MDMRTWATTATAVVLLASVAGCGGDDQGNAAPIGAVERSEQVSALNLAAVTEGGDVGTLVGTLLNETEEADTLVGVEVETDEGGPVETFLLDGPVELPPGELVRLSVDERVGLRGTLREGLFVELTLQFANSPDLTDPIPVEPPSGPYADVEVPEPSELTSP